MWEFSDTNCSTFVTGPFLIWPLSATWAEIYFGKVTSAATQSATMRIACFSDVDFVVRIDDAIIFPVAFVDGFETGNTSNWSSAVP